jgi:protein-S-isoprenylcysteine O-methyltransferase Ste14
MALIEEMDRSGNRLFKGRSFIPLFLYAMAAGVIWIGEDNHLPVFDVRWAWACLGISLLGQLIRVLTIGFTPKGTSGRNTSAGQVAEQLNTSGIYSTVRHPLYLGNFFMWLGIIIYVGNWWFTALCCLMYWLYYERIMFAEEHFLRNKFGHTYLDWANKTPAFWPALGSYQSANLEFSLKNVLKREYNGFFAIFLSFSLLDIMRNYTHYGFTRWQDLITPFWHYAFVFGLVVFLVLRSLKKYTRVLEVAGR